jgi:hypothetical protein
MGFRDFDADCCLHGSTQSGGFRVIVRPKAVPSLKELGYFLDPTQHSPSAPCWAEN